MVLAIVTKKKNNLIPDSLPDILPTIAAPRFGGGLTLRILSVNLIAPVVLALGLLYLGQYRDSLIAAELKTMTLQSQLFAGAIAEGAVRPVQQGKPFFFAKPDEIEVLIPELSRRMLRRLGETMETRTQLFNDSGVLIGDSRELARPGPQMQKQPLQSMRGPAQGFHAAGEALLDLVPMQNNLPVYSDTQSIKIEDYPDAALAIKGSISGTAWKDKNGNIILTASSPVQKARRLIGVVLLSRNGDDIQNAVDQMRFDVLTVFLGALSITIFLSMYLAGLIGRPLKKLARAAETVRMGHGRQIDIPDLTHRNDEIGELSAALRDMTRALWDRMDTIERFAADVAHEIKNPLTSLRSAMETAVIVKDRPEDLGRLLGIMQHDVTRMNRLISDISNASRLDAELSRDEVGIIDIKKLLQQLVESQRMTLEHAQSKRDMLPGELSAKDKIILVENNGAGLMTRGSEHRLAQVIENLLSNALSFSPPDGAVTISAVRNNAHIVITVQDQGPGIPDAKLESIFERFYTERPKHEDYGSHSGLGLSIARQIITAMGGVIYAENVKDSGGKIAGAAFIVILNRA